MTRFLFLAALGALAACSPRPSGGAIDVSVIGSGAPRVVNAVAKSLTTAEAVLLASTAQGLVRFDASGQIQPGLAIRWAVSDDGLYYTFRIADGQAIDAKDAARLLRAATGPSSRNPLAAVLGAIRSIVAVTPQVIEIELRSPRPDLLMLLAQPELALVGKGGGTGPFRIAARDAGALMLTPVAAGSAEDGAEPNTDKQVRLRTGRAAMAVVRFKAGEASLVLGGSFADLAIARAGELPANTLRFDPVQGLFGLAVVDRSGFLGPPANRRALSMAIDRNRIVGLLGGPAWRPASSIVPPGSEIASPATPDWIDAPLPQRRAIAADTIATWNASQPPPRLRVALPDGPGSRALFALIAADWARIGVTAERVAIDARADLRLIDRVAPSSGASWYLRQFSCEQSGACSGEADTLLGEARAATNPIERAARLADADARLAEITPFIALAMPLRWALVSPRLTAFQENARGVHPLDELRRKRR